MPVHNVANRDVSIRNMPKRKRGIRVKNQYGNVQYDKPQNANFGFWLRYTLAGKASDSLAIESCPLQVLRLQYSVGCPE